MKHVARVQQRDQALRVKEHTSRGYG
jgi:hypothetical protein